MILSASFLSSLLLLAAAKPMGRRAMTVHESRAEPARGFVKSSVAPASKELTLRISLKQNDMSGLEKALYEVSDPASALYGQHLTPEKLAAFVKPTAETLSAVSEWLSENDISSAAVTPFGDMLEIKIPVSQANDLLSAEFAVFTHVESGSTSVRTLEYSIPAGLKDHINFFHPTLSFTRPIAPSVSAFRPLPKKVATEAAPVANVVPASCANTVTPACLQAFYNIPTTPATTATRLGVSGFILQWANQLDLQQFLRSLRTDISPSTTFTLQTLDGGVNTQTRSQAGVEANLDIQYTIGVATNVPVTFISVGENGSDGLDGFLDIITTLINEPASQRPSVLSTSYGFDESDLTRPVANNLCNAYMQLGALGTSLIFSSGDGGVSGSQSQSCTNFIPTLPSDCPLHYGEGIYSS
ncbi:Pro-kumamolisin, activation domain-containing protein [Favolaschia claudopus]|uniref:Pro-kumamolisin, activation domain-containing protein n=1 Tax=Favolaschia claudopus TaxID=2862362 RepID=A0AAV9ZVI1_9AGAR